MVNYYHVLGLTENASPEEIKSAFKRLAVKYHPDKHPDRPEMEEKFKEINQAHQVLSDPYEKARFDLKLKYQQFSKSSEGQRPYTRKYSPPQARYYRSKVDQRKNAIATAYAFGITFLIASIVMGSVWIKRSYDNHLHQKELAARRATFQQAKKDFEAGNFKSAYEIMAGFRFFDLEEKDMKVFKNTMVDQIIDLGNEEFKNGQFEAALDLYHYVLELKPNYTLYEVKEKMADAYRNVGNVDEAMAIWNDFLVNDYDIIGSLVNLAEVSRDLLNDNVEAMDNFQLAHKLAVKRYKRYYGEGYMLVIKPEYLPESHYRLYHGLADMYLQMDDPRMAIKASDWNKYVWPDSTQAYLTTAEAYLAVNQQSDACTEYSEATIRGWQGSAPISCN